MTTRTVEQELVELERDYWQAVKNKDVDAMMSFTADPCIITGAQGVRQVSPRELGQMVNAMPYTLHSFTIDDAAVEALTDDVAIVAYKVHEDLTVEGKRMTLDAADASTWVRRNGRWVCALHTESILGDPFGR